MTNNNKQIKKKIVINFVVFFLQYYISFKAQPFKETIILNQNIITKYLIYSNEYYINEYNIEEFYL